MIRLQLEMDEERDERARLILENCNTGLKIQFTAPPLSLKPLAAHFVAYPGDGLPPPEILQQYLPEHD